MGKVKTYLTIGTGDSAATAVTVLATSDPTAIEAALGALVDRLVPEASNAPATPESQAS